MQNGRRLSRVSRYSYGTHDVARIALQLAVAEHGALLPQLAPRARVKFNDMKDLLAEFAREEIGYKNFYTELQLRLGNWQRWQDDEYP
jgi:hypothetical protein